MTRMLIWGIISAVVLCKYSQAEWNTTNAQANGTVSCNPHDNSSNCTDSKDDHKWSGHFSKCPKEYKHYCIHGDCRFVEEQNTPSCRCEMGYIGSSKNREVILPGLGMAWNCGFVLPMNAIRLRNSETHTANGSESKNRNSTFLD
ncbi:protransforming growth factor alpha [Pimephales promelas]|nr:protransforming growth factor alpha [Pimephales promelas]